MVPINKGGKQGPKLAGRKLIPVVKRLCWHKLWGREVISLPGPIPTRPKPAKELAVLRAPCRLTGLGLNLVGEASTCPTEPHLSKALTSISAEGDLEPRLVPVLAGTLFVVDTTPRASSLCWRCHMRHTVRHLLGFAKILTRRGAGVHARPGFGHRHLSVLPHQPLSSSNLHAGRRKDYLDSSPEPSDSHGPQICHSRTSHAARNTSEQGARPNP